MQKIIISRKIEFDAAHRVYGHEGKCKYLHGHRYSLEAEFSATTLDALGRVIDFSVIKERVGEWINTHWDHNTILWEQDKPLGDDITRHTGKEPYYLKHNPTAENLALFLKEEIFPALFKNDHICCERVILHETPNCKVIA